MGFDVQLREQAEGARGRLLADLVGEAAVRRGPQGLVLSVVDQAALVSVVARINDLGLHIERVERVHPA